MEEHVRLLRDEIKALREAIVKPAASGGSGVLEAVLGWFGLKKA